MSHISQVLWQSLVKWLTNFSLYPPEASKIAPQMDALYFFMVLVSLIGLTIVILLVVSFSILYSKRRHPVPVQLTIISQDVFHSFSIPAFRVKREAIPGRYTSVWFEATTPGTYHLFCTQYCGTNHSAMIGDIVVLSPDGYKQWLAESTSGMSLAQSGERLFASLSCNACHNGRPDARGP